MSIRESPRAHLAAGNTRKVSKAVPAGRLEWRLHDNPGWFRIV